MDLLTAIVLGTLQGLTEFLPVSSSGHLVLGGYLLGLREPHLLFDIVVHVGTLVATVVFYRRALLAMARDTLVWMRGKGARGSVSAGQARFMGLIGLGSIPTAIIGIVFREPLEALFGAPRLAGAMLLVTGMMLLLSRRWNGGDVSLEHMRPWQALIIGTMQGFAIIPGISRSGATITAALVLGLNRELAARFSFLLALPAILGALLLKLGDGYDVLAAADAWVLAAGGLTSSVIGVLALAMLIPVVRGGRFFLFGFYLLPLGAMTLWLLR